MPQVQKWEVARGKCIYREPNVCSTIVLDSILETMVRQTTGKKNRLSEAAVAQSYKTWCVGRQNRPHKSLFQRNKYSTEW